jgi:Mg/Co/Ni transporter MgtE
MVLVGALAGLALGMASVRYVEALLYQVKAGDPAMLALPSCTILAAALLAALPAVFAPCASTRPRCCGRTKGDLICHCGRASQIRFAASV